MDVSLIENVYIKLLILFMLQDLQRVLIIRKKNGVLEYIMIIFPREQSLVAMRIVKRYMEA